MNATRTSKVIDAVRCRASSRALIAEGKLPSIWGFAATMQVPPSTAAEDDVPAGLQPDPSLHFASLDRLGSVIRIGSFSKTLSASVRCGYIAAQPDCRRADPHDSKRWQLSL